MPQADQTLSAEPTETLNKEGNLDDSLLNIIIEEEARRRRRVREQERPRLELPLPMLPPPEAEEEPDEEPKRGVIIIDMF